MALKLVALDPEDLAIISTYSHQAIVAIKNIQWDKDKNRIIIGIKRYKWERDLSKQLDYNIPCDSDNFTDSILHFERVSSLNHIGMDLSDLDKTYKLIALSYINADELGLNGDIILHFENSIAIKMKAECVEARLVDM